MASEAVEDRKTAVVAQLREQIRRVQAAPRRYVVQLSTGLQELDALGVFRLGAGVELSGEEASGRSTLALSLVASACREKRLAAWVDGPSELYPPSAEGLGVELSRLLIVRPQAPGQVIWAAVQLLRSGAFACVVLDVSHTGVTVPMAEAKKLIDAARAGGSLLVLLTTNAAPAQGFVRLALQTQADVAQARRLRVVEEPPAELSTAPADGVEVEVVRSSAGGMGRRVAWQRAALRRGPQVRARRALAMRVDGLAVPQIAALETLRRVKRNELRDGWGLQAMRPGRDAPLQLPTGRGGCR